MRLILIDFLKFHYRAHSDVAGTIPGHSSWVLSVSFAADGKHFASSSSDKTVKVWSFGERRCLYTFKHHTDQVWSVKYGPDGNHIVSVSADKSINLYRCPEKDF